VSQQKNIAQFLIDLAMAVQQGKYGKEDEIDGPSLIEDAEEMMDDLKEIVGYGN
jgi:hypothetical protein